MDTDLGGPTEFDVIVVGSGAAALTGALTALVHGLRVVVIEKTTKLGGTSAMSGAATWVPGNHHAAAAGVEDSPEEAFDYLRATAPAGWIETEEELWRSFAENAGPMLRFVEAHTRLRYKLTNEPDVYAEAPGAKPFGRMVAPQPLRWRLAGEYANSIRRSTLPHLFTYQETTENDLYRRPARTIVKLAPRLFGRLLTGSTTKGTALIVGLLHACLNLGCRILLETRVVALVQGPSHADVAGVIVERGGRQTRILARRGVLLATGGFEWNRERLLSHFPGGANFLGSSPGNEGDALTMAEAVGADLAHLDQALIFPCIPTRYEGRIYGMPAPIQMEPNAILVDRSGRRFTSEYAIDLGEALDRRDPQTGAPLHLPAWLVSDASFPRLVLRWYARYDPHWMLRAATIETLAVRMGLPPTALAATVARFNGFYTTGRDEDFRRGETLFEKVKTRSKPPIIPIKRPPFVAIPFGRSILSTKGGLRTNAHGEVLRPDRTVIPGLYCVGAAMANPIGTRAISAGTTIGPNMTWGFIAALRMIRNGR